jgi:hypothetical protein
MLTLINADEDEDTEITDPREVAELFAAIAEVAIEALGPADAKAVFMAVIERAGGEMN